MKGLFFNKSGKENFFSKSSNDDDSISKTGLLVISAKDLTISTTGS